MEDGIKDAIISAESTASSIKKMAQEEARVIVLDSKNNASRIVNEALLKAEKIQNKSELLEKNINIFKRKFKIIIEQQKAVIEEIDELELPED